MNHKEHAKNVFEIEAEAIANLSSLLTDDFNRAVDSILDIRWRLTSDLYGHNTAAAGRSNVI